MEETLTILMATYNGERFIREQLDSIIKQTYKEWCLVIRDDCSKDNTPDIIKEYCLRDTRIKFISGEKNLGPVLNFNELIKDSLSSKYIMFADQDDIWLDSKIEISLKNIKNIEERYGENVPIIAYSKLKYVTEDLKPLNIKNSNPKNKNLRTLLSFNFIWGCTIIANSALINEAYPISKAAQNHDYWLALHAAHKGIIYHIEKETMLYRQHKANVTGGINNRSLKSKIKKINNQFSSYEQQIKQNLNFITKYQEDNNQVLLEYKNILLSDFFIRVIKAYKFSVKKNSLLETIIFYIFLLSKYQKENSKID